MNEKDMRLLAVPPPFLGDNLRFTALASEYIYFLIYSETVGKK